MTDVAAVPRDATPEKSDSQGMNYLVSLPRRVVTVYLPLAASCSCCCSRSTGWS